MAHRIVPFGLPLTGHKATGGPGEARHTAEFDEVEARVRQACLTFVRAVAMAAVVGGALVLAGRLLGFAPVRTLLGGQPARPNCALALIFIGAALFILSDRNATARAVHAARAAIAAVLVLAAATMMQHVTGWELGIDRLLLPGALGAGLSVSEVRMAPASALAFLLLGASLLAMDRATRLARATWQLTALLTMAIGVFTLLGYLYGVVALYRFHTYPPMGLDAAAMFTLLGAAVLHARPEQGIVATSTSGHVGGQVARWILPAALLLPIVIGWLRLEGQKSGFYGTELGLTLFAASNAIMFAALVWFTARSLNDADQYRLDAEQALRRSEELFSKTFHANPAGMVLLKQDGLRYVDMNEAWLALTGFERHEVIGRTSFDTRIIPDDEREAICRGIADGGGRLRQRELVIRTRQGEQRDVLYSTQSVTVHDEPHILGVLLDVSERNRAEAERASLELQVRQTQKLQALGTLAAGIAHDFNNILAIIEGSARLSQSELPPEHPVQASLAEITAAGQRASELVRRILTFGRRQEVRRLPLALAPVLEEALNLLRPTLSPRLEITLSSDADTPIVLADPTQVHQLVLNLGTNAAHAMGEAGGTLEFQLSALTVTATNAARYPGLAAGSYAELMVRDNGCGMEEDVLRRIFDPFFTTKRQGEGTGLGLAVVHGIMKAHDGSVTARSRLGIGTTFLLHFPAAPATASVARPVCPTRAGHGSGERILYIDDEASLVRLGTRLLERLGYKVTGDTNPLEALARIKADPAAFDAVVTDLSMPGMSGLELAREVREIRAEMPIFITSGCIRQEDTDAAAALGISDLITKPDTIEGLGRALHRKLARH
jgi:PAS domain S-box-containing protein